jgi:ribosome biogenesis protein ENP2
MKVSSFNGVKVYNLSAGKTLPQFLTDRKKRALSKDDEYRRRLEIIQDFDMPESSQCIKMTKDREHVIVTGTYPPVVKCFTVSDMALKFERGLTSDVVAFECLSDDYGKLGSSILIFPF